MIKTLREAMDETIELYEFISELKAENNKLRLENAKLISEKGGEIISETEKNLNTVCRKYYAQREFGSDWNWPKILKEDNTFVPFKNFYESVERSFLYGKKFDDFPLKELKEYFYDEIKEQYNEMVSTMKKELEDAESDAKEDK